MAALATMTFSLHERELIKNRVRSAQRRVEGIRMVCGLEAYAPRREQPLPEGTPLEIQIALRGLEQDLMEVVERHEQRLTRAYWLAERLAD